MELENHMNGERIGGCEYDTGSVAAGVLKMALGISSLQLTRPSLCPYVLRDIKSEVVDDGRGRAHSVNGVGSTVRYERGKNETRAYFRSHTRLTTVKGKGVNPVLSKLGT